MCYWWSKVLYIYIYCLYPNTHCESPSRKIVHCLERTAFRSCLMPKLYHGRQLWSYSTHMKNRKGKRRFYWLSSAETNSLINYAVITPAVCTCLLWAGSFSVAPFGRTHLNPGQIPISEAWYNSLKGSRGFYLNRDSVKENLREKLLWVSYISIWLERLETFYINIISMLTLTFGLTLDKLCNHCIPQICFLWPSIVLLWNEISWHLQKNVWNHA